MSAPGSVTPGMRARAAEATRDTRLMNALHLATFRKVDQRAAAMAKLRNGEALRSRAKQIKQHTLEHLPRYLGQLSERLAALGARVHFAPTGATACDIIRAIAREHGCKLAVKAKSMTSEEIHLNAALQADGVRVVETDLGEFIVQLDGDRPSHIVTPIIHKDRRQVAATMQRELGIPYTDDPTELTRHARRYLRQVFAEADLGITGVNFAIAETGTLCICTNEGNGRMSTSRPRVHVALLGIEKVIPRLLDLPVFLKLLARGSTGQPLTVYTSLITGPRRATDHDGPEHLHVVFMDNGRSPLLGTDAAEVLECIRCGACLNACPAYRNIGGHAYQSVYPGPIGALVTPLLHPSPAARELAGASSLCGACQQACPVKIDIPRMLVRLREQARAEQPRGKQAMMGWWLWVMRSPRRYRLAQRGLRLLRWLARGGWMRSGPGPLREWTRVRDLPVPPARSFRQMFDRI